MNWNNLKQPPTTYNDLQWARNDLKWSTKSKTKPSTAQTYLQWAKKKQHKTTNSKKIFRLFYNMGQSVLFSNTFSTQNLVTIIQALLHRES